MIEVAAHAKVNLFLAVLGRRPDGFHEIDTVLHAIDLADTVVVQELEGHGVEVELERGGDFEGELPEGDEELSRRAARALLDVAPDRGAAIRVTKRIPLGSGMGGGSSDAAAVLLALDRLWDLGLGREGLAPIAARLGSDVPYFLHGGTARARGRGETVEVLRQPDLWFVIGMRREGSSTAGVYEAWSPERAGPPARGDDFVAALSAGDVRAIAGQLHNDLERPAFELRPELRASKDALAGTGVAGALMSGSGPTIFGVCSDEAEAESCAAQAAESFDRVLVAGTAPPLD